MNLLDEIFTNKRAEVAGQKLHTPLSAVRAAAEAMPPVLDFVSALRRPPQQQQP